MRVFGMAAMCMLGMLICSCASKSSKDGHVIKMNELVKAVQYKGEIRLYGETHGVKKILDKEFEIWNDHYQKGDRHLFVELPYYTAEYLNAWLKADDDRIFDGVYADWEGTASHNPDTFAFFKMIKAKCPETVFHGTDVGHQYVTTGKRFLLELEERGLAGTKEYELAQETIEQGKKYYNEKNDVYRENTMVENFIREAERVNTGDIVGIYGSAHTGLDSLDNGKKIPCMANQLKKVYVNSIQSTDLTFLAKQVEPVRIEKITINNKEYVARYYGKQDLNGFKGYVCREFWKLDGAYVDLKNKKKTGDYLPSNNYPMTVEFKQMYVIDYTKQDQTKQRMYYRTDGEMQDGEIISNNIDIN